MITTATPNTALRALRGWPLFIAGSPTLNKNGELCGLLFDGVWESIASDYVFVPKVSRSIHGDATYMRWVMDEVDRAHDLLREMRLPVLTAD